MSEAVRLPYRLTTAEYLAYEQDGKTRYEFVDGVLYAMVGGSDRHNLIALNLASALSSRLPDACQVFEQSMKLRIAAATSDDYYYPDLMVSCDETDRERLYRERPSILGEVLSPSSEREDRREKFAAYTALPSLREYVLIAQDVPQIELFRRENAWQLETFFINDTITFPSAELSLPVQQIYRRIAF